MKNRKKHTKERAWKIMIETNGYEEKKGEGRQK